jgi:two-component system, LytTR family, response regulator
VRILIVDDEAPARSRLRKLLGGYPECEIVGEAGDGLRAVSEAERLRPDLLLLDVQMPGLTGFEVVRSLASPAPLVVFVTAYDEYALAAFEANAVGYLRKPVNRERLAAALERARTLCQVDGRPDEELARARRAADAAEPTLRQLVCRKRDRFVLVPLDKIVCIGVEDGIVKVWTGDATYRTDYQLAGLAARLPDPPFFRVHRSALVNMNHVREIAPFFNSTYQLVLDDRESTEIQVSERQSKRLREMLRAGP